MEIEIKAYQAYCHPADLVRAVEMLGSPDIEVHDWVPRGSLYFVNPASLLENLTALLGFRAIQELRDEGLL